METFLHLIQGLMALNGFIIFEVKGFYSIRYKIGMAIAGLTLIIASIVSFNMDAWYPLLIGYVLLWLYRLLGLDPSTNQ